MTTMNCELTDTFGGEANYSWVRRATVSLPENATRRAIVRAAKSALGITGARCETTDYGDMLSLRLRGACIIAFVTFAD